MESQADVGRGDPYSVHELLPLYSVHDLLPLYSVHELLPLYSGLETNDDRKDSVL